jgi:Uma2 family endonuclease
MATVAPAQEERPEILSEPDGLYEVIDGRFVEKPMGAYECWLLAVISNSLSRYVEDNSLGRAVPEMIFDLRPTVERERRPDVAFVSFERWARNRRVPHTRSWAVVPDLAIEIVSPTNTADEVAEKLEEYFQVGVRNVWVVYPRQFKVYAYTSPTDVRVLALGDELDGGDVLPGFRLPLQKIFEQEEEP